MEPVDLVAAVSAACLDADGVEVADEATLLALRHRGLDGAWFEASGSDGFALVRDGDLTLAVTPSARRRGEGARLAAAGVEAGAERAWSHGDHPAAARIADRLGWRRARELWVMRLPVTPTSLPDLTVPDGVTIRGFAETDVDAVLAVNAAAFAHHPEQGSLDREGFAERTAEAWFDPAGLLLAVDDETGDLLGFHWTKQHSPDVGEVYVVGVSPDAQGRGLGRVLTLAGLRHLADAGVAEILLYVEADNAPAVHVYAALGFTHAPTDTHVQYRA